MKPTILLYDSGMGGLTIYDEIRKVLPNAHYLYCFDNAYFPYSEKSEATLIERAIKIVQKIAEKQPLDMVVVACNTASTVVLPALREAFDFPIVGTVPAIKPAAVISQTKTIGLLATKGTVARPYVKELVEKYAKDCTIEMIGTTDLVEIVEEKQRTGTVDLLRLQEVVKAWVNHPTLDTVILGCTHFPLVKEELKQLLPSVKYFVDPGIGIAKRVTSLLNERDKYKVSHNLENRAFCTTTSQDLEFKQSIMKKWGFSELIVIEV
ncbi:glutamate racemase [Mannheimia sp. AT1]|uniref:Glutamate racemase n=1 Tax=Mannheimia cairinae TaxID=3025936 RepID=A0ABT5MSC2_9PAST|nr:glutamate racemase [Mannheimia cairinae]MDD0825072.1 glutamate racemase [Mannheimia cairinae]MDD0826693.1 glutamate racemase [Mannheimia cairinae]